MRLRKPQPASLGEVRITRDGHDAVIEFHRPGIAVTHLHLGPRIESMSDGEILRCFNDSLRDQAEAVRQHEYVAHEIPSGEPQLEYFETADQWAPRGSVLRCSVDDSGPDGEAVVYVDDVELSLAEFGRLLCTYAGWGMRLCFVPEERLEEQPKIVVGS